MRKYVYLFELDSARRTNDEIINGLNALYREISTYGNTVVLTYNQVVESRGFLSLLKNEQNYENIVELFKNGAIKISQYRDVRSISQYLLNAIDDDSEDFVFVGFPIKKSQKRLLALIRRCLVLSDLSELSNCINSAEDNKNDIRDLFTEVVNDSENDSAMSFEEMKTVLENLSKLISIILRLSPMNDIYLPPKPIDEYRDLSFFYILTEALKFSPSSKVELWTDAINIIKKSEAFKKNSNKRSDYHRELLNTYGDVSPNDAAMYAEAIIDLTYNYTCEISICNTSKRYNISELKKDNGQKSTFRRDFFKNLELEWKNGEGANLRYLQEENNTFKPLISKDIPDFSKVVHLTEYIYKTEIENCCVRRYEYELKTQNIEMRTSTIKQLFKRLPTLLLCILIAMVIEVFSQGLQSIICGDFSFLFSIGAVIRFVFETIVFLIVGEVVSSRFAKEQKKFLSLSDALLEIKLLFSDFKVVCNNSKINNFEDDNYSETESYSRGQFIDYFESKELKKYKKLKAKHSELFPARSTLEFADTDSKDVIKQIMRDEEIHSKKYGMIYSSKFNTMLVDPVYKDNKIVAYERVCPTAGNGAVLIVKHKGQFVLLWQFRHAIGVYQYSFPRGFAESEETTLQAAVRELEEELNPTGVKELIYLGDIAPDSGLSGCIAGCYLVEIDEYNASIGEESISDAREVTEEEFKKMIKNKEINDGFTLAAYTLYKNYLSNNVTA